MNKDSEPKYINLKNILKTWIEQGDLKPGDQIPTEFQLADRFHMSRQTVRMALNELVFENVLVRYRGKGTFVSDKSQGQFAAVAGGGDRTIAVISTYLTDYIFPSIIEGIESRLSENGCSMLLFNTDNSFEKEALALENILRRSIDGVIVEPTQSALPNPNIGLYLKLFTRNVPVVTLHSELTELAIPCLCMDDEFGGQLLVEHLHELGHTFIGCVMKWDDRQGHVRMRGVLNGVRNHRMTLCPEATWVYHTGELGLTTGEVVRYLESSAADGRPTAIVCYNDEVALDLMRKLNERSLHVPEIVSIVSFDDSYLAEVGGITSVAHPKRELGLKLADTLLSEMNSVDPQAERLLKRDVVFKPNLSVRNSSSTP